MTNLVALVDGSIYSRSVCDHAAWAAMRMGAGVELIHVIGRRQSSASPSDLSGAIGLGARTSLLEELSELDSRMSRVAQTRGRAILEDAVGILKEAGADEVSSRLRNGDLLEELQACEEDADLIVIGKRGDAADFATGHLGSNLERIARAAKRPLLVVARAFKPIERAMVAYDGGPSAERAAAFMAESPLFEGIDCHLLTVGEPSVETRGRLKAAEARLQKAGRAVAVHTVPGQPDKAIIDAVIAEKIDLLMIGAYGHSRIRNLIIGSTTTEMVRQCRIPVMMFR